MRIPPSLSILPIFAIAACDLDIKHCIGDCTQGSSDSQTGDPTPDTTGDPTTDGNPGPVTTGDPGDLTDGGTDPTGGDELGTCEIVDDIPLADTCFDGQFMVGELCILGTFGFGTPATSSLVLPLDAHHGADLLLTPGDDSVEARLFAPATTSSLTWAQTIGAQLSRTPALAYLIEGHGLTTWAADADRARHHTEALELMLACELAARG